jgi:hypothetical protein
MSDRLIFVSCGQLTPTEKRLARLVQDEIDSHTGFRAYSADRVQSLTALCDHVFDALRRCAGAVVLIHAREGGRSSMWVNQELAILAYRRFFESADIPIIAFKDNSVTLEGAMSTLIVNANPLGNEQTVVAGVARWLTDEATKGRNDEHAVFTSKWAELQPIDRLILKALIEEGGKNVKESSIRNRLIESLNQEKKTASSALMTRRVLLSKTNFVRLYHNTYDGDEVSLHPAWEWYIRHELGRCKT